MSEYVYIPTGIFTDPIFDDEPFGKATAFLWLSHMWDGSDVRLIAKTFKWPANRVWRFLREIVAAGLVDNESFYEAELFYRKKAARTAIPAAVKAAVSKRDGEKCRYCGSERGPFHYDHVFPWSRGGDHKVDNLVIACQTCNLKKRDKTIKELGWANG